MAKKKTTTTRKPAGFLVIQQGGTRKEIYVHSCENLTDAKKLRVRADKEGSYKTSPSIPVPMRQLMSRDVLELISKALVAFQSLDYPKPAKSAKKAAAGARTIEIPMSTSHRVNVMFSPGTINLDVISLEELRQWRDMAVRDGDLALGVKLGRAIDIKRGF